MKRRYPYRVNDVLCPCNVLPGTMPGHKTSLTSYNSRGRYGLNLIRLIKKKNQTSWSLALFAATDNAFRTRLLTSSRELSLGVQGAGMEI